MPRRELRYTARLCARTPTTAVLVLALCARWGKCLCSRAVAACVVAARILWLGVMIAAGRRLGLPLRRIERRTAFTSRGGPRSLSRAGAGGPRDCCRRVACAPLLLLRWG
jgi:hypothetical protein